MGARAGPCGESGHLGIDCSSCERGTRPLPRGGVELSSRTRGTSTVLLAIAGFLALCIAALLLVSGRAAAQVADRDLDGIADANDNCAEIYNPDQDDHDEDGVGTTCDETTGVPADESYVVLYLRDQNGRPVRDTCFTVTVEPAGEEGGGEACTAQGEVGFVVVQVDPAAEQVEISQGELPTACSGGLPAPILDRPEPSGWKIVTVRYRCGAITDDGDLDLVSDEADNCPSVYNPEQDDSDEDGTGSSCDPTPGVEADESHVVFYLRDQDRLALGEVCFEVTEVRTDETLEPADVCVEPAAPGDFVTSLDPETVRLEIAQTAAPPGCRGGLRGKQTYGFAPGAWRVVDLRYTCGVPVTFTDRITPSDRTEQHAIRVIKATKRIEFRLRWRGARNTFDVTALTFGDADRSLAVAGQAPAKLKITRRRTATSLLVRVEKLKPGKLKPGSPSVAEQLSFRVVGKKVTGATSVATQVSQAR